MSKIIDKNIEIDELFDKLDLNQDNILTKEEIKINMCKIGLELDETEINELVN